MSTATWNEGYFTDVDYLHGYYSHLNPHLQRFFILAAGYVPLAPQEGSAHCELGFGQGTSINAHAIASPYHFVGTDFTPSQAAFAREVASAAGVDALLLDDSFEQLLARTDMPQFDSISLHGIWTWVSAENRRYITEFARRHLKPGGVFQLSYNAQPGWSSKTPIRQLLRMRDVFAQSFSDLPEGMNKYASTGESVHERRIGQSLDLAEAVIQRSQAWISRNPGALHYFKNITDKNRSYLAHEYFNSAWDCMFFADVAAQLDAAKLNYVCTADISSLLRGMDRLETQEKAKAFLSTIAHPVLREQVADFWRYETFRMDIFQRGSRRMPTGQWHYEMFEQQRFVLTHPLADSVEHMQKTFEKCAPVKEAVWRPMLEHIASRKAQPKNFIDVAQRIAKDAKVDLDEQIRHIALLVDQALIAPCQTEAEVSAVAERCKRFNRWALERFVFDDSSIALVSPLTGGSMGSVGKKPVSKLLTLAWLQGHTSAAALPARLIQLLGAKGSLFRDIEGNLITDHAQIERTAQNYAREFLTNTLPHLQTLQML